MVSKESMKGSELRSAHNGSGSVMTFASKENYSKEEIFTSAAETVNEDPMLRINTLILDSQHKEKPSSS